MSRKIYLASSWRNCFQQTLLTTLRKAGHDVYDYRNPVPGNNGFHWSEIDSLWQRWMPEKFRATLHHKLADQGFGYDWAAMQRADACVLLLPCGRSAHLAAGYLWEPVSR